MIGNQRGWAGLLSIGGDNVGRERRGGAEDLAKYLLSETRRNAWSFFRSRWVIPPVLSHER